MPFLTNLTLQDASNISYSDLGIFFLILDGNL